MLPKNTFFLSILAFNTACATPDALTIKSDPPAEVTGVDPKTQMVKRFGMTPLKIVEPWHPLLLTINKEGYLSHDFLVLDTQTLSGEVSIKLRELPKIEAEKTDPLSNNSIYLDKIAKAHRQLLFGLPDEARLTIRDIEHEIKISSKITLSLLGLIELTDGHPEKAISYYEAITDDVQGPVK